MKLTWITDPHLNFLDKAERQNFYQEIINTKSDGVLISGDIAEAPSVANLLNEMAESIKKPIYFVLGNHDYYKGQVNEVREEMKSLTENRENLFWLPASGMQKLSIDTFLIGQDGWADGRLGDYTNSRAAINDSRMIADLFQAKIISKYQLLDKMQSLADADAMELRNDLERAVKLNPKHLIVLTHVPPYRETCMHMGEISDGDWLPYFSCKIIGDVLTDIATQHPSIEFLVLCGHTHSESNYQPLDNLTVKTGKVEYQYPEVQEVIIV